MPTLKGRQSGQLPVAERPRCESSIEMRVTGSERQLEEVIENQPVSQIVTGASPLLLQIEGISGKITVPAWRQQRVVRVINGVRPRVRRLNVHSMAEAFVEHALQSVVSGIPNRLIQRRLRERQVTSHLGQPK